MQSTRLVYRLEDDYGYGPFQNPSAVDAFNGWRFNGDPDYPSPAKDPDLGNDRLNTTLHGHVNVDALRVGCTSPEQLRRWFDEDACKALAPLGYFYTVWRCPEDHAAVGRFQVVFDASASELVDSDVACRLWAEHSAQLALPLAA